MYNITHFKFYIMLKMQAMQHQLEWDQKIVIY